MDNLVTGGLCLAIGALNIVVGRRRRLANKEGFTEGLGWVTLAGGAIVVCGQLLLKLWSRR